MAKLKSKSTPNFPLLIALLALAVAVLAIVVANSPSRPAEPSSASTGNGAPNGAHYNLNLVGIPRGKTADMTGSNGHVIFVPLSGNCKIMLSPGDFTVTDANCTNDGKAGFMLPNPDPTNTGTTTYSVWARALGRPGGSSRTTTCATDPTTGEVWCSVYATVQTRNSGRSTFTDVSKDLLYIYADLNADGTLERYNLFDSALQDYYWNYDNTGLKLMQLRFYQVPSTVPTP